MVWLDSSGSGSRTVLLLHGLGATAAVWSGMRGLLRARADLRCVAVDLPGHGRSAWQRRYSVGSLAAEVAAVTEASAPLYVIGHSLGAYVALALASGWFGVKVDAVVGIGPKIAWAEAELQSARELARRPLKPYASEEEAWGRYRRVAGLGADIAPGLQALGGGIVAEAGGWRLAQDPRTFAVAGAPFATLAASASARVRLARGERDSMVALEELRHFDARARELAGLGHNAHVEAPHAVVALLDELLQE